MAQICQVHTYETAEGLCRSCGGPFCADCLVYPFGPAKPPLCVPCAVAAGGVRRTARNPTVVVPKETKRRLKDWRKARKRDLASPPPDGVATWQKMDEAKAADEEEAAEKQAAAEHEALRLPPPETETPPPPPPDLNVAPPGPLGDGWRDEIDAPVATDFGLPGSNVDLPVVDVPVVDVPADVSTEQPFEIAGASALGAGWTGGDPGPRPGPEPADPSAHGADRFDAGLVGSLPFPDTPTTYGGPAIDRPVYEPTPFDPTSFPPAPTFGDATFEPTPFEPKPFEPTPFGTDPAPTFEDGTVEPTPFGTEPAPTFGDATLEPTPFPSEPVSPPLAVESVADALAAFGLSGGEAAGPLPPPPPAAESRPFDPLPPPPPAAEPIPSFTGGTTPDRPTTEPPAVGAPDLPPSPIRPPTPTRIPAADQNGPKTDDAKAILARIAALRGERTD